MFQFQPAPCSQAIQSRPNFQSLQKHPFHPWAPSDLWTLSLPLHRSHPDFQFHLQAQSNRLHQWHQKNPSFLWAPLHLYHLWLQLLRSLQSCLYRQWGPLFPMLHSDQTHLEDQWHRQGLVHLFHPFDPFGRSHQSFLLRHHSQSIPLLQWDPSPLSPLSPQDFHLHLLNLELPCHRSPLCHQSLLSYRSARRVHSLQCFQSSPPPQWLQPAPMHLFPPSHPCFRQVLLPLFLQLLRWSLTPPSALFLLHREVLFHRLPLLIRKHPVTPCFQWLHLPP